MGVDDVTDFKSEYVKDGTDPSLPVVTEFASIVIAPSRATSIFGARETCPLMAECQHCGEESNLPFRCSYCDVVLCNDHRLPESHDCDGVEFLSDPGKRFESKFNGEVIHEADEIDPPEPLEPAYTVGTTPDPEYESAPPVTLKRDEDSDGRLGLLERLRSVFRR